MRRIRGFADDCCGDGSDVDEGVGLELDCSHCDGCYVDAAYSEGPEVWEVGGRGVDEIGVFLWFVDGGEII